jgi:hypothetical protein
VHTNDGRVDRGLGHGRSRGATRPGHAHRPRHRVASPHSGALLTMTVALTSRLQLRRRSLWLRTRRDRRPKYSLRVLRPRHVPDGEDVPVQPWLHHLAWNMAGMLPMRRGFNGACSQCGPGYYAANMSHNSACTPCGAGHAQPSPGSTACTACNPGFFRAQQAGSVCEGCSPGQYQSAPGQAGCIQCGAGQVQPAQNSGSCSSCEPGFYAVGGVDCLSCLACSQGQYQDAGGQSGCIGCGAGTANAVAEASALASDCIDCDAGRYSTGPTGACTACESGFYSDTPANDEQADCIRCVGGGSNEASTLESDCTPYVPGTASFATCTSASSDWPACAGCVDCSAGQYQPATGQAKAGASRVMLAKQQLFREVHCPATALTATVWGLLFPGQLPTMSMPTALIAWSAGGDPGTLYRECALFAWQANTWPPWAPRHRTVSIALVALRSTTSAPASRTRGKRAALTVPGTLTRPLPGEQRAPQTGGSRGFFDPPEHLLTSVHTILIEEFDGHLPSSPSF